MSKILVTIKKRGQGPWLFIDCDEVHSFTTSEKFDRFMRRNFPEAVKST